MSASTTRLLVLGVLRFSQPASGYGIMRELMSWDVQDWASVNPGSVYGAVRALAKEGLILETAEKGPIGRKDSAHYELTDDGEAAFGVDLRRCLWDLTPYDPAPFLAALCFLPELTREEVTTALRERAVRLESLAKQLSFQREQMVRDVKSVPPHARELVACTADRLDGELGYVRKLAERIEGGELYFEGESKWRPERATGRIAPRLDS